MGRGLNSRGIAYSRPPQPTARHPKFSTRPCAQALSSHRTSCAIASTKQAMSKEFEVMERGSIKTLVVRSQWVSGLATAGVRSCPVGN